jgi:hypothetical protein
MSRLSDVVNAAVKNLLGTYNNTKAVLAINLGGAATVKTTSALSVVINGVFAAASALAAQSIAIAAGNGPGGGGGYVQPFGTTVYYTMGINAAGTFAVKQGTYAGQGAATVMIAAATPIIQSIPGQMGATYVGDGSIPALAAGYCPIGVMKVVTNASTAFTPGTTALDAAGVTATYFDVAMLPDGAL